MAKIVCVLYEDPVTGYPEKYARDDIPRIERYPDGQTTPTPKAIDFKPGQLLGSVSGELGLRKFLESLGHTLTVTSDKDGPNSAFEMELIDADIVISQPFWPAYLTSERIGKARNLKLAIAGLAIGIAATLALTRVLTTMLFEISPHDPWILAGASLLMLVVTMLACYLPARRATRVDPIATLRTE